MATMDESDATIAGNGEESGSPLWVWIGLSAIACASFWCQAIVTEERLVPALNVIATHYSIPSDIAGATLMAAGASSPELFSSIVSLFITHSSLGLGTIVGSEIFNQLIICAGAVYSSKTGLLALDKAIVTREVGFYALGIALLYFALSDSRADPNDPDGPDHIYVSFLDAVLLFGGYLLYVAVCANMERVVGWFNWGAVSEDDGLHAITSLGDDGYGAIEESGGFQGMDGSIRNVPKMPFFHNEPVENFDAKVTMTLSRTASQKEGFNIRSSSFLSESIRSSIRRRGIMEFMKHSARPTELHTLYDLHVNEYKQEVQCFLWQQSVFYTMAYFGSNAWHLRWFTIMLDKVSSIPDRQDPENGRLVYPKFTEIFVDEKRLIINLPNPKEGKKDFTLMAPSKEIFEKVVSALGKYMAHSKKDAEEVPVEIEESTTTDPDFEDADAHEELIDFPCDGSLGEIIFWVILYPLRFLMHHTLPDVRQLDSHGELKITTDNRILHAFLSTFMCLVWLIVGSYAMVASLESLAELMDIPDAVIGFTVSAAGTSLPNYVASKVSAENGFGNQAVSNAFGSNTFNLMVGLGLPWSLYIAANGFEPYHGLRNEGIVESILIMAGVLAVFVVLMTQTNFVIVKWHGILFLGMYIIYVAFAIGQVYIGNNPN
ncbi:hypothetical protein HJC23_012624 [Cyclotella cryptica]|uniref:Sodium/calcium exchanger membrane region domain-containing protein n=1 Tax=Cyclotella cryptica TaxID=29204 RepID=A0ABD3QMI3_9STRA